MDLSSFLYATERAKSAGKLYRESYIKLTEGAAARLKRKYASDTCRTFIAFARSPPGSAGGKPFYGNANLPSSRQVLELYGAVK